MQANYPGEGESGRVGFRKLVAGVMLSSMDQQGPKTEVTDGTEEYGSAQRPHSYAWRVGWRGGTMRIEERLDRIEQMLTTLVQQQTIKEWYTTAEVAGLLGRAEYTVREWCRQGRIRAKKKPCGRGKGGEWLVSHEELTRLKNEGLLPFRSGALAMS